MPTSTSKQTVAQFGATVKAKHPEYGDLPDAEVGSKVLAKYPEYGDMVDTAPPSTPAPAKPGLIQGLKDEFDQSVKTDPKESLFRTGLKRTIGGVMAPLVHPVDTVVGMAKTAGEMAFRPPSQTPTTGPVHSRMDEFQSDRQEGGLPYAITKAGGDVAGMVVGGKMVEHLAPPVIEGTASTLNAGGRLLKGVGAGASKLAVGAPAAIDNLGASAGRGLSQNRIVGLSKPSLLRKVGATIAPAAEARDSILRNSDAAPTDVRPLTQAPFDDISEVKTDPKTGAVRPAAMGKMDVTRRAIQNVQDPNNGTITSDPKDLNLTPAEMGRLQTNVYDMADYETPDSDLANQYTKGVGARLKGAIDQVAPEASTATGNLHDLLGAQEHLKATAPKPPAATDLGLGKLTGRVYDAARVGGGTALGAGADLVGTGMMKTGGALRRLTASPVAPTSTPAPGPRRTPLLEANTPTDAPGPGPEDLEGTPATPQRPPIVPPSPVPPRALGAGTPEAPANTHPGTPGPGARTRIAPTEFAPSPTAPAPRKLIASPDGGVTPEPYSLGPGAQPAGLLESTTGRGAPSTRPSLLRQFRRDAGAAAVGDHMDREMAIRSGQEKLAQTPEGDNVNIHPSKVVVGDASLVHPTTVYKGAFPDAADNILKKGIDPTYGKGNIVHGTTDPEVAAAYTQYGQGMGDDHTILETQLPRRTLVSQGDGHLGGLEEGVVGIKQPVRPELIRRMPNPTPPAPDEVLRPAKATTQVLPTRLPDPTDIDGWEKLVDEGHAQYNVHTHQYDYTGPITRRKLTR